MPYTPGDNWLADAPAERRQLQDHRAALTHYIQSLTPRTRLASSPRPHQRYHAAPALQLGTVLRLGRHRSIPTTERDFRGCKAIGPDDATRASRAAVGDAVGNACTETFSQWRCWTRNGGANHGTRCRAWMIFAHRVFQELAAYDAAGFAEAMSAPPTRRYQRELATWFYVLRGHVGMRCSCAPVHALRRDREARRCGVAVLSRRL